MAKKTKKETKKKKEMRFLKVYFISCVISLVIGAVTFISVGKITKSIEDTTKNIVKIPSYEALKMEDVKQEEKIENDKIPEKNEKVIENNLKPTLAPKEVVKKEMESAQIPINTEENESVKAVSNTEISSDKEITFTSPCDGILLKDFSVEKPIKSKTMGDFRIHNGVDIKSTVGDSVFAVADGKVEQILNDTLMGVTIIISHTESLKTQYSNLAGADMVKEGQEVKGGDCIGCVGDTAKSELLEEAHLHFAVMEDGKYQNPKNYIDIKAK